MAPFLHILFQKNTKIKTIFLEYNSLRASVKKYIIENLDKSSLQKTYTPFIPFGLSFLFSKQSMSKEISETFKKNNSEPIAQRRFTENGLNFDKHHWKRIYSLPYKCTLDTSLHWLQYRILHRILATNTLPFKMNIVQSDICSFCGTERETLEHLFYDCYIVKEFLSDICQWFSENLNLPLTIDKKTILFGLPLKKTNKIFNWVLLQCKKFIYKMRIKKTNPNCRAFKNVLSYELNIQKFLLLKNCRFSEFENHWKQWIDIFD